MVLNLSVVPNTQRPNIRGSTATTKQSRYSLGSTNITTTHTNKVARLITRFQLYLSAIYLQLTFTTTSTTTVIMFIPIIIPLILPMIITILSILSSLFVLFISVVCGSIAVLLPFLLPAFISVLLALSAIVHSFIFSLLGFFSAIYGTITVLLPTLLPVVLPVFLALYAIVHILILKLLGVISIICGPTTILLKLFRFTLKLFRLTYVICQAIASWSSSRSFSLASAEATRSPRVGSPAAESLATSNTNRDVVREYPSHHRAATRNEMYHGVSYSVFSATLRLSITALFREPKAREDLQLDHDASTYRASPHQGR
jgi:hypothetical protein